MLEAALCSGPAEMAYIVSAASRHDSASQLDRSGFKLLLYELSIAMVPYLAICASAAEVPDTCTPALQLGVGLLVATLTIQLLDPARELSETYTLTLSLDFAMLMRPLPQDLDDAAQVLQVSCIHAAVRLHPQALGCWPVQETQYDEGRAEKHPGH